MLILISFVLTLIFGSFMEYWLHRLMHSWPKFGRDIITHYDHHRRNEGQGVIGEFKDYLKAVVALSWVILISRPIGIGFILGACVYAIFSAYAHQLQHDNPSKCFWMKMPVHYVHHKYNQWHHNFGLGVDCWDKVFGTYKPMEWQEEAELNQPERGYLQIKWW
jgi:sterol desaturase/sphingolipid hydroxylase (fatty acid hydroxylase superfamily)